ncbi:TPA: hypothetical protein ACGO1N_000605, partial [Streptococcus suis]
FFNVHSTTLKILQGGLVDMWETTCPKGQVVPCVKNKNSVTKNRYCFIQSKYVINLDKSPCLF